MSDWIDVIVAEKRAEAQDIAAFVLQATDGGVLPAYEAGAHIDVRLPNGLIRQYSLCGEPGRPDRYELGILMEAAGRGGSRFFHEQVGEGSVIQVSPPRNLFGIVPGKAALLFAGGIGVTPILAMAEHASRSGAAFEMHYCTRSASRAAFRRRIDASAFASRVCYHFDDQPETRLDARSLLRGPRLDTHIYVCGPDGFMDYVLGAAREAGWSESAIHFERFSAAELDASRDGAFEIEIADSGRVIAVPAGKSALEALAAAGIDIPVSCEQGICGTCLTEVIAGVPDHRDMFLSEAERAANNCFTPCCSRALTSRLVIQP